MKKLTIIAFFLFLWNIQMKAQFCPPGNIVLSTQSEVDSFPINYPGCHVINGSVLIGTYTQPSSNITNLNALAQLTSIVGSLNIGHTNLMYLDGLENIDSVGSDISIMGNPVLINLTGFNDLIFIGGVLDVEQNAALTSFDAFNNLTFLGGVNVYDNPALLHLNAIKNMTNGAGVTIVRNNALLSLDAFDHIKQGLGTITILQNQSLLTLDAFYDLDSIGPLDYFGSGGLSISDNPALTSLTGLENLVFIHDDLDIDNNDALLNLSALNKLNHIGLNIHIHSNDKLGNLDGLSQITSIDNLSIDNNAVLTNIEGLNHLLLVNNEIYIVGNPMLTSLAGLDGLVSINKIEITDNAALQHLNGLSHLSTVGQLNIENNAALINLTGLEKLSEINYLVLYNNASLSNLNGLDSLQHLNFLNIRYNSVLTSLSALHNLGSIEELVIVYNPLLSDCAIYAVCDYITVASDNGQIHSNGPGCSSIIELEEACGAIPVIVSVSIDSNGDCLLDSTDIQVPGIQVRLSGTVQMTLRPTQSNGLVQFGYLDDGPFILHLPQYPTNNWAVCQDTIQITPDLSTDTISRAFLLEAVNQCPELSVELGLPPAFRGCLVTTPMSVTVTNTGTINAEGVSIAVVMPSGLELVSSDPQLLGQSGDTLFFAVGALSPFAVSTVNMTVKTNCDSFYIGQALCLEAFAGLNNPCSEGVIPFSEIRLFSQCVDDSIVRFLIKNVGTAPTQGQHQYVIIEDEIIMLTENFNLNEHESLTVDVPSNGATYRMEATKYDNGVLTATVRENCGGQTPGFVTSYWFDRSLRSYDFDCRIFTNSFDPNQKTAIPTGIGSDHLIVANAPLEYTIEFQNTGTDTAFRVLLRDVLPPEVDIETFRPGYASHPYTWEIRDDGKLEVLFSPIALPDSNTNEPASHGFFNFTIDQKPNLPDGTILENTASIIFDYNPPIVTNTVMHTIGKLTVSVDEPQKFPTLWQVFGNPTRAAATFHATSSIEGEKLFELTDMMGHRVQSEQFTGQTFEFQRGTLPGGVYMFSISDVQGRKFTGKIVVAE